jgi:hypothetical protein
MTDSSKRPPAPFSFAKFITFFGGTKLLALLTVGLVVMVNRWWVVYLMGLLLLNAMIAMLVTRSHEEDHLAAWIITWLVDLLILTLGAYFW